MDSILFRLETARRLRTALPEICASYISSRHSWMDSFHSPNPDALGELVHVLADVVERNDPGRYQMYASTTVRRLLQAGVAPILILEAQDVFHGAVLAHLTRDQSELVERYFAAAQDSRELILQRWLERGA